MRQLRRWQERIDWQRLAKMRDNGIRLQFAFIKATEGEKLEMDYAPRKIKLPDDMTSQESFTVQKHHLDTNHHVNNCQYICMAEDFLPEDFKVYQMRAEYKMQAKLGDIICPKAKAETGKVIVSLDDTDGKAYAIIEFQQK